MILPLYNRTARPGVLTAWMAYGTIIFSMMAGGACAAAPGVVADRFEVSQALEGDTLTISLDTDLPDETKVMVDVSRRYRQAGDTTAYVNEYFEESGTVGGWRTPRSVVLDEARWRAALSEKQRILARGGAPFDIGRVEDTVIVSFVIPVNQPDRRFGDRNQHLSGSAVSVGLLGWPLIERELHLFRKAGKADPSSPRWADPGTLQVGRRYALSRETSLMPELNPADPMGAIERIRVIPQEGSIGIVAIANREVTQWYEVEAYDGAGARLGSGWVNSTALIGQDVQEIR